MKHFLGIVTATLCIGFCVATAQAAPTVDPVPHPFNITRADPALDALIAPDAWAALSTEFPELRRLEETLAGDPPMRDQLVRLYGQHVREWNSFSALRHLQQQSPTPVLTCVV